MVTKKNNAEKIEREYTIPLREKCRSAVIYKKTPKAIKSIKEFLAKHMKIENRDLKKIKLDKFVNETVWARGIRKPVHKIKVKVIKENGIVTVKLAEPSKKFEDKKKREEKRNALGESNAKKKPSSEKKPSKKVEDKDKDGVKDSVEIKEKESSVEEKSQEQTKKDSKKAEDTKNLKNETSKAKENKVGSA